MKTLKTPSAETAKGKRKRVNLDWWNSLSQKKQKEYVEENPNTQYKKYLKKKDGKGKAKDNSGKGGEGKGEVDKNKALQNFNYNEQIKQQIEKEVTEPEKKDGEDKPKSEHRSHPAFDHKEMDKLDKEVEKDLKGVKKLSQALKSFHEDQKKFFKDKDYEEGSEQRRKLGNIIRDKSKGLVKALKEEGEEWKHAANSMKKIFNGEKLSHHEKAALKNIAIHAALVVGPAAVTGGLSAGVTTALPHLAFGFLEHSLVMSGLKAAVWAKKQDVNDMTEDELLEMLIEYLAKGVEKGAMSKRDWVKAMMKANALEKKQKASIIASLQA